MKEAVSVWGQAHEKRGSNYRQEAVQFAKDFPIGTTLTNDDFDKWAHHHGYLNVPFDADKQSDVWLAHLTRRNRLRINLFKASTHPSMLDYGVSCYVITMSGSGMIVETPEVALQQAAFATKLDKLIGTKRKRLGHLMQSVDINQLPEHQRALAENLYDELSDWNNVLRLQTSQFDRRLSKLTHNIRLGIASGDVIPKNHALQNLLTTDDDDDGDNTNDDMPDFLSNS